MLSKEDLLKKAGIGVAKKVQRPVFDHVCPGCGEVIGEKSSFPKMQGNDFIRDENGDIIITHCCGAEYVEERTPEERQAEAKRMEELASWFGQGVKQASVKVATAKKVIAVDLDGTLAHKDPGPFKPEDIGKPVPKMMDDVKAWIAEGHTVVIFTARAADPKNIPPVKTWLAKHGLGDLKVTNRKTPEIGEFHDDRAITRQRNTGEIKTLDLEPEELKSAAATPIPTTGPAAIAHALRILDLDKMEQEAKARIASGKKTHRGPAITILNAVQGMRRNNITPADLLITKVPIMPAKFRPYITVGKTLTLGDANELIRDLIQTRNARQKVINELGEENSGDMNLALYDATAAFMGYGDPVNPKSLQRGVKGVLHRITGDGPKHSWLSSKMIAKPQDNVGRSVVTANPDLGMDEVGIPEEMAWSMFSSKIQGELVKKGMSTVDALKAIKDRTGEAKHVLDWGIDPKRGGWPVVYSRAPAWHQFNTIAGWAKLHPGKDVQLSPLTTTGANADFDGDSARLFMWIAIKSCAPKTRSSKKRSMTNSRIKTNYGLLHISCFPKSYLTKTSETESVTNYSVKPGIEVYAYDPNTRQHAWTPVTEFSEHRNLDMRIVKVGETSLTVSDDHSLIVFKDGKVQTGRPDESTGLYVPRVKVTPTHPSRIKTNIKATGETRNREGVKSGNPLTWNLPLTRETGLFVGLVLGDGCVNKQGSVYLYGIGDKAVNREAFDRVVKSDALPYTGYVGESTFDTPSLAGDVRTRERSVVSNSAWFSFWLKEETGDGALNKKIPAWSLSSTEDHLLGLLDGLMSTDGNISWTVKPDRPAGGQIMISFASSSEMLVSGFQALLLRLGVQSSVTPYKSAESGRDAYIVNISSVGMKALWERTRLTFTHPGKNTIFQERIGTVSEKERGDPVPYPTHIHSDLQQAYAKSTGYKKKKSGKTDFGSLPVLKSKGCWSRSSAKQYLQILLDQGMWSDDAEAYLALVKDEAVAWDEITEVHKIEEKMTAWDLTVPGPFTFAAASGHIVQDTVNVHAYVTPEAIKEAKEKLMPSRMVFSGRDFVSPVNAPKHEQILGIYDAQTSAGSGVSKRFPSRTAFIKAYEAGDVDPDDDVEWDSDS